MIARTRRPPPPTLPAPRRARGPLPPSRADSGRARRGAGGPRAVHAARARASTFGSSALFLGSPEPSLPSPAPSAAAAAAAAIFRNATAGVVISSPTDPRASRFRREGGRWGREEEVGGRGGRLGQVSVLAAAGVPAGARPPGPGGGGGGGGRGRGAEGRLLEAIGRTVAPGVAASGHRGGRLGPSPAATPHSAPAPLCLCHPQGLGEFLFSSQNFAPTISGAGAPGKTHLGSVELCSLPLLRNSGDFFFFLHNSFPALSLSSLSPPSSPLFRSNARTLLTPEFSLQLPRAGATLA